MTYPEFRQNVWLAHEIEGWPKWYCRMVLAYEVLGRALGVFHD